MNAALVVNVGELEGRRDQAAETAQQNPRWYVVFGAISVIYVTASVCLTFGLHILAGDAMSRTASASFVVLSRDPHVAAIGFIWNPLPTFVQIPLVLLLRPFGLQVLSGPLQSAFFMAGASTVMWQILGLYPLPTGARHLLAALFALNPLIVIYAADGMSEASFLFFIVGAIYFFILWSRGRGYPALIGTAFMMAGAFGTRYEAIPLAAAGALGLILGYLNDRELEPARLEASLLAYLTPLAYAVFLWVLFNWMIMGDPLFFQNSIYGNAAQVANSAQVAERLRNAAHNVTASILYVGPRLFGVFPAFGIILLVALGLGAIRRNWRILSLIALVLSVPAFHLYVVYKGQSFGWLRYFMYSVPGAFVLVGPVIGELRQNVVRNVTTVGLTVSFLVSAGVGTWLMGQPNYVFGDAGEPALVARLANRDSELPDAWTRSSEQAVSEYVDRQLSGKRILLDTTLGSPIVLFSRQPEEYVISSDRDFDLVVADPRGKVDYVLVPPPVGQGKVDEVNRAYPGLYERGASWASLAKDFGGDAGWRLYRVVP